MRNRQRPLYMIRIVSQMLNVHPQTLRLYEREGLVVPKRLNRFRYYSDEDVERLNLILKLTRELGVNKAGVDIILRLRKRLSLLQELIDEMMGYLDEDLRFRFKERLKSLLMEEE
ncbi:MAG: MerR family transcriptional regulator [Thermodesulfovibrionales bacterium]|nr:MerR family transcriptional regulator [Thermodesulfovibrionales bacterium]